MCGGAKVGYLAQVESDFILMERGVTHLLKNRLGMH